MKAIIFILVGTIGLGSCDYLGVDAGSLSQSEPGDSGQDKYITGPKNSKPDPYPRKMSKNLLDALEKEGVPTENILVMPIILGSSKKMLFLGPNAVFDSDPKFPLSAKAIGAPFTGVPFRKSHCLLWSDGSTGSEPNGGGDDHTSGGQGQSGVFCLARHVD